MFKINGSHETWKKTTFYEYAHAITQRYAFIEIPQGRGVYIYIMSTRDWLWYVKTRPGPWWGVNFGSLKWLSLMVQCQSPSSKRVFEKEREYDRVDKVMCSQHLHCTLAYAKCSHIHTLINYMTRHSLRTRNLHRNLGSQGPFNPLRSTVGHLRNPSYPHNISTRLDALGLANPTLFESEKSREKPWSQGTLGGEVSGNFWFA